MVTTGVPEADQSSIQRCFNIWVYLKMGYTPNYSHLVGIMISLTFINYIGCRATLFSDKPIFTLLVYHISPTGTSLCRSRGDLVRLYHPAMSNLFSIVNHPIWPIPLCVATPQKPWLQRLRHLLRADIPPRPFGHALPQHVMGCGPPHLRLPGQNCRTVNWGKKGRYN